MKQAVWVLAMVLAASAAFAGADDLVVGDWFHVTGCENGELMVKEVFVWSLPAVTPGAKVVATLSGGGKAGKCQGDVVKLVSKKMVGRRLFLRVHSPEKDRIGYIGAGFAGVKAKKGA